MVETKDFLFPRSQYSLPENRQQGGLLSLGITLIDENPAPIGEALPWT